MKYFIFFLLLVSIFSCDRKGIQLDTSGSCVSNTVVKEWKNLSGTVEIAGNEVVIDVAGANSTLRFYPCNLPGPYQQKGKLIRFDAREYEVPPNVRVIGTPIIITQIY